jgi:hypothetical protein
VKARWFEKEKRESLFIRGKTPGTVGDISPGAMAPNCRGSFTQSHATKQKGRKTRPQLPVKPPRSNPTVGALSPRATPPNRKARKPAPRGSRENRSQGGFYVGALTLLNATKDAEKATPTRKTTPVNPAPLLDI